MKSCAPLLCEAAFPTGLGLAVGTRGPRGAEAACPGPADGSGDTTATAGGEQRVQHALLSCSSFTASLAVLIWGTLRWPGLGA